MDKRGVTVLGIQLNWVTVIVILFCAAIVFWFAVKNIVSSDWIPLK